MTNITQQTNCLRDLKWAAVSEIRQTPRFFGRVTKHGHDFVFNNKNIIDDETRESIKSIRNTLNTFFGVTEPRNLNSFEIAWKEGIVHQPSFWLVANLGYRQGLDKLERRPNLIINSFEIYSYNHTDRYCSSYYVAEYGVRFSMHINGVNIPVACTYDAACQLLDVKLNDDLSFTVNGRHFPLCGNWPSELLEYQKQYRSDDFAPSYDLATIGFIRSRIPFDYDAISKVMNWLKSENKLTKVGQPQTSGISKVWTKLQPYLQELFEIAPLEYAILMSVAASTKRTIQGVKCSAIFNATFESASSVEELRLKISKSKDNILQGLSLYDSTADSWYTESECFQTMRKDSLKRSTHRAFNKLMEDIDFIDIDPTTFPRTYEAITNGDLPLGTFFRKKEQYFLLNDNFELWEEMLEKHYDAACALGKEVAPRTTYEKDLMSYFYFVLRELPAYLKEHTGEDWTCIPRAVNSSKELEPPKEDANGTRRERSALTPIVDNDKKTVTVPYASLAMSGGYGTTYCYSHDYHVLRKGFSFNGNTVMKDLEEKLNGRDDYGLMFYTLTGSAQGRGYPTFLIIFERRRSGTHVHFHRTHPSRSKDGDYNPIHNWTRVCYNWMIGNVPRHAIGAQQGDLAFVKIDNDSLQFPEIVKAYDNHCFDGVVSFAPYTSSKKENVLGYIKVDELNWLRHHEHEDVPIEAGVYEVRQCRSWEANPKGVWSLRID